MFTRVHVAVFVVCVGLIGGSALLLNADEPVTSAAPTAAELYDQAMRAFDAGDLDNARTLLRKVDPMQLPAEQRVRMYEVLTELDIGSPDVEPTEPAAPAEPEPEAPEASPEPTPETQPQTMPAPATTPAEMLAEADAAADDNPSRARALYRAVIQQSDDEALKATAEARLAHVNRRAEAQVTAAKKLIDQAQSDLDRGDVKSARAKLQSVKDSGVVLGWFDAQRLDTTLAEINMATTAATVDAERIERETMAEVAEGAKPEPATDPTADHLDGIGEKLSFESGGEVPLESQPQSDLIVAVRKAEAQKEAAMGKRASEAGHHALAAEHYQAARRLDPGNEQIAAAAKLAQSKAALELAPRGVLETATDTRQILVQRAMAEFNQSMNEAETLRQARQYAAARDAVANARTVLDRAQRLIPDEEYNTLRAQATERAAMIDNEARDYDGLQQQEIERKRQQEQEQARYLADLKKKEEINELLARANELRRDQKYDEALELVDQALFLDPTDKGAQGMQEIIQDVRLLVAQKDYKRLRGLMRTEQAVLNAEALVPYDDLIIYPADWPQITERRLSDLDESGGESEVNRRVSLKLREPVPISFEANKLVNVIEFLRNTTGVNFFVNWPALEAAGVEQDAPITLQLSNVPAEQALKLVLAQVGSEFDPVTFSIISGIVTISTERDLQKTTDRRTYDIRDLLVQVPNFTNAPEFDLNQALSNTSSGGGGGGGGSDIFGDTGDSVDEEQPTRAELIDQITNLIQDSIGRQEEWAAFGGDVSSVTELNGQLIVKTTPENHRQINDLLAQLRETRAVQISVESRFLIVQENFLEEVGVDLDFQINDVGGGFGPIRVAQDSYSLGQRGSTPITPGRFQTDGSIPGPGAFIPGPGFEPRTGRSLNLAVAYVDDLEVNLLIQATQANQRSIVLTSPRVTFFNGQRAFVLVTEQVAFISDLEPIPDAIGFDVTTSVVNSGAVLDVEGTVSADRRYVTLTMRPSLANFRQFPFRSIPITGSITDPSGIGNQNVITFGGFVELPEIQLVEVNATVSIPDRGTLLLGGQRLVGEVEIEAGVPVLSKMPIVNRLFTNSSIVKDERTLLILIKPTIIIQSEEENQLFPGLLQDPEQYNVGRSF